MSKDGYERIVGYIRFKRIMVTYYDLILLECFFSFLYSRMSMRVLCLTSMYKID